MYMNQYDQLLLELRLDLFVFVLIFDSVLNEKALFIYPLYINCILRNHISLFLFANFIYIEAKRVCVDRPYQLTNDSNYKLEKYYICVDITYW